MDKNELYDFISTKECKLYDGKDGKVKGLFFVDFSELDELVEVLGIDCETRIDVTLCEGYIAVEFEDALQYKSETLEDYKDLFDDWEYYFGKGVEGNE